MSASSRRLRARESRVPLPPPKMDLGLEQIESQCVARCSPGPRAVLCLCHLLMHAFTMRANEPWQSLAGDERLLRWNKGEEPIIEFPPTELGKLTGFRDPFVFQRKTDSSPWKIIIGSGVEGQSGTILLYESQHLSNGAQLVCRPPADDARYYVLTNSLLTAKIL